MSNYLQSRQFLPLLSAGQLFLLMSACSLTYLPENKAKNSLTVFSKEQKADIFAQSQEQLKEILKNTSKQNFNSNLQLTKKELPQQMQDRLSRLSKYLSYDPQHPSRLFDGMILTCSALLNSEKLALDIANSLLGSRNSYVIKAAASYKQQEHYLLNMKQQRNLLIEQESH